MNKKELSYEEGKKEFLNWMDKGWSEWWPLEGKSCEDLPDFPGVYEVRLKNYLFARLRGTTSIVYIGCTDQRGLRKRIKALVKGRHIARKRVQRIVNELQKQVEFRVKAVTNPKQTEKDLLKEYEEQHLELPPCNHSIPK